MCCKHPLQTEEWNWNHCDVTVNWTFFLFLVQKATHPSRLFAVAWLSLPRTVALAFLFALSLHAFLRIVAF